MTTAAPTHWTDEELDAFVRGEMRLLQSGAPVPAMTPRWHSRARRLGSLVSRRDPTRPRRLAPAAAGVGVAVLLAAGSGTWFTVEHLHARYAIPASTPQPVPSASPPATTPVATPAPYQLPAALDSTVPANTPVFYYVSHAGQPQGSIRLEALDWSGAHRGHVDVPGAAFDADGGVPFGILQSPDGERLLIGRTVYASDGRRLFNAPDEAQILVWADDSRSLCYAHGGYTPGQGSNWAVTVLSATGTRAHIVHLPGNLGGDAGYNVEACAVKEDRIVAYRGVDTSIVLVTAVQISTGRVELSQSLCNPPSACTPEDVAVTPDGRVSAEAGPDGIVHIRDLGNGRLRTLAPRGGVLALSSDGSRLLMGTSSWTPNRPLMLVDAASGRVLWTLAGAVVDPFASGSEPRGSAIALAWHPPAPPATVRPDFTYPPGPPSTLVLLRPGGAGVIAEDIAIAIVQAAFGL
jgi:hypothetical protein